MDSIPTIYYTFSNVGTSTSNFHHPNSTIFNNSLKQNIILIPVSLIIYINSHTSLLSKPKTSPKHIKMLSWSAQSLISLITDLTLHTPLITITLSTILLALLIPFCYQPTSSIVVSSLLLVTLFSFTSLFIVSFSVHHYVSKYLYFKAHFLIQPRKPSQIHIFVDHEPFDWPLTLPEPSFSEQTPARQSNEAPTQDQEHWPNWDV